MMSETIQITRSELLWTVVMAIILGIFACYAFFYLTGTSKVLCPLIEIKTQPQLNNNSTYEYMKQHNCSGIYIWTDYSTGITKLPEYLVCQKSDCLNGGYCKYIYERIDLNG
jgi:uncharacterized membrane protein